MNIGIMKFNFSKMIKYSCVFIVCFFLISGFKKVKEVEKNALPKVSFTFDDGDTNDYCNYKLVQWNELILEHLEEHNLKAILFSMGHNKLTNKGKYVLSSWNSNGHYIANHSYSHYCYCSKRLLLEDLKSDFIRNDSIVVQYSNFIPLFRFPYLKAGETYEKVNGFNNYLYQKGYKKGHVTIDASDWYISNRLIKKLEAENNFDISLFKEYYLNHLFSRAVFYDSLSYKLTNRRISHVILLHHNLAAALFLGDLIKHFKSNGWEVIDADLAYKDEFYSNIPLEISNNEGLVWALAKKSGLFKSVLRYPAEDEMYEKALMDSLGL